MSAQVGLAPDVRFGPLASLCVAEKQRTFLPSDPVKSITDLPIGAWYPSSAAAGIVPLGRGKWQASEGGSSYPRSAACPSRGRSPRARSRRASCRLSGTYSITKRRSFHAPTPLWSDCVNLVGARVATLRSNIAGRTGVPSASPSLPPSSCSKRSTSLSPMEAPSPH